MPKEDPTPLRYLSMSEGLYRVIDQGMPICADKKTMAEALAAATAMRVKISDSAWNGDLGEWVQLKTLADEAAASAAKVGARAAPRP